MTPRRLYAVLKCKRFVLRSINSGALLMIFFLRKQMCLLLLVVVGLLASVAEAHVVRVEITSRADIQEGKPFGAAGGYEKITGRVYFAVDPTNLHNRQIVDLDKAERNSQGEVEFSSDFYLLRPKETDKGNGAVLFEVSNRGGKGILRIVNGGGCSAEFGGGFLMSQGFTCACLSWPFYPA